MSLPCAQRDLLISYVSKNTIFSSCFYDRMIIKFSLNRQTDFSDNTMTVESVIFTIFAVVEELIAL